MDKQKYIDLHCHIVPYVDDGAQDFEEAEEVLFAFERQGIRIACATPHLRAHMFETPDAEVFKRFRELRTRAKELEIPVYLVLSREYHCDENFFKLLGTGGFIPMGEGNTILCEFSHVSESAFILDTVKKVREAGYRPLVAHVERYRALYEEKDLVLRMKQAGALIQVNAGSITGDEGGKLKRFCKKLVKDRTIDVIASDSHDPVNRPPFMKECAETLAKMTDTAYIRRIMLENPYRILKTKL